MRRGKRERTRKVHGMPRVDVRQRPSGNVAGTIFNQKERLQRYSIEVSRRGNFSFFTDVVPSITPGLAQA